MDVESPAADRVRNVVDAAVRRIGAAIALPVRRADGQREPGTPAGGAGSSNGSGTSTAAAEARVYLPQGLALRFELEADGPFGWRPIGNLFVTPEGEILGGIPAEKARDLAHGAQAVPLSRVSPPPPRSAGAASYTLDDVAELLNEIWESFTARDKNRVLQTVRWHLAASAPDNPRSLANLVDVLRLLGLHDAAIAALRENGRIYAERGDRDAAERALFIARQRFAGQAWLSDLEKQLSAFARSIDRLSDIVVFHYLADAELLRKIENDYAPVRVAPAGTPLIEKDQESPPLIVVKSGVVKVHLGPAEGQYPDRLRFAGDVLGEIALVDAWDAKMQGRTGERPRATASVLTLDETEVWRIPESDVLAWHPGVDLTDFMEAMRGLSQRRNLDSHLASAPWLRGLLGARPSQADRNEMLRVLPRVSTYEDTAMEEVVPYRASAESILLVARGSLVEESDHGGKRELTYYEPGDAWGVGEARHGFPSDLNRRVRTSDEPTVLLALTLSEGILARLRGDW